MKQTISIILIVALTLPVLNRAWIFISFKANQDFIAEVLCINREKPMTTCNGQCFLAKKLKKQEEKESKQVPQNLKQKVDLLFMNKGFMTIDFDLFTLDTKTQTNRYISIDYTKYLSEIFRPPKENT